MVEKCRPNIACGHRLPQDLVVSSSPRSHIRNSAGLPLTSAVLNSTFEVPSDQIDSDFGIQEHRHFCIHRTGWEGLGNTLPLKQCIMVREKCSENGSCYVWMKKHNAYHSTDVYFKQGLNMGQRDRALEASRTLRGE